MKKTIVASLIGLAFAPSAYAIEEISLEDVTVKANRFERKDTETTYASEIHTSAQIKASGASTLYDYLNQQSSLNLGSNFGNTAAPSINLRGYGQNGFQNVVITLDGQRLNNIDLTTQVLTGISLGNIERIEISKGSGSVIYGDGATAGAIQIYTKAKKGVSVSTSWGNFGQRNHYINAGISEKNIDLSANLSYDSDDGFSKTDSSGHRNPFNAQTQNVKLKIKPNQHLSFIAEGTSARNKIGFSSSLTKAQFKDDPRQPGSSPYTSQDLDTDQWKIGSEFNIHENLTVKASHYREDKTSLFSSGFTSDYEDKGNDIALSYDSEIVSAIVGLQTFDGERTGSTNITSKDNKAYFVSTEYHPKWLSEKLTLSLGGRKEKVTYKFSPELGGKLKETERLSAWDVGVNYRISPELSIFSNYNKAYQAPDIDRFFKTDFFTGVTEFNGFISPVSVRTLNVGLNHVTPNNRLKITVFKSNLHNEIYFNPASFANTNLDSTNKFGVEVQDHFKFNDQLSTSLIYNYTRAIVKREIDPAITIKNKDLPNTPRHTFIGNINYHFVNKVHLNLNHVWRSKAYSYNDFQENLTQKQDNYETTNLAVNYDYKKYTFFAALNNIFEKENSIQVGDDNIYPVDFVRTWRIGMKADF